MIGTIEIPNVSRAQAVALETWTFNQPEYASFDAVLIEWTPTNTPELAANTARICVEGDPADLLSFRNSLAARAQTIGKTATVVHQGSGLMDDIEAAVQAHGFTLPNRPALKAAIAQAIRNNRTTKASEVQALKRALSRHFGVTSISQLRTWLNNN